ncbi:heavy-metal-associated domain-containing protein, partial [Escherichia marmotae]|uniref:heavy-metal-associated domain-containing protein n=1 Tax=Escherichia marmotae TaxID=1499973 RepID=UPI0020018320
MGVLDHLSEYFDCPPHGAKHKKRKQLQPVELKIRIDCEGCERKVKRALQGMKGVKQVDVDRKANKATVVGYVEPAKVVACVAHRNG